MFLNKDINKIDCLNAARMGIALLTLFILCGCSSSPDPQKRYQSHIRMEEKRRNRIRNQTSEQMRKTGDIPPIEFEFDRYELLPDSIRTLDKVARIMLKDSKIRLVLEGHCDDVGSYEYNDWLALMRTSAVQEYLIGEGILPTSIKVVGFGERKRSTKSVSWRARGLNRRVELMLTTRRWESVY